MQPGAVATPSAREPLRGAATDAARSATRDISNDAGWHTSLGDAHGVLATILASTPDAVFVKDLDGRYVLLNQVAADIFGRPATEILGRSDTELLPPDDAAALRLMDDQVVATGRPAQCEQSLHHAGAGAVRVFHCTKNIWRDPATGAVAGILSHAADVTERVEVATALERSNATMRLILDGVHQGYGIFGIDATGRVTSWNTGAERISGYRTEDVIGSDFSMFFTPEAIAAGEPRELLTRAAAEGATRAEGWRVRRNGLRYWARVSVTPLRDAGGAVTGYSMLVQDVTEQQQAAELRQSEALYSGIVALASDAIITIDSDQRILLFNHGAETTFGYRAEEVLGQPLDILLPEGLRERHREVHLPQFAHSAVPARRMAQRLEVQGQRRNGERFPAEVAISRVSADGALRYSAILRDVTERRRLDEEMERQRTELGRSNTELARSNAELEQFAYVASHDLQEPLRAVASHTELLQERYSAQLDVRALKHIRYAVEGAHRMQSLIDDLLTLSRVGTHARPFTGVNLDRVLADVLRALDVSAAESAVMIHCGPLPVVNGDPAQLSQVFLNLIGNAFKFHRPGVRPEVDITAEPTGGEWTFAVRDNGIGIDPAFRERVFEVFKRLHTRDEYPGTGIGLSICRKVIDRHGGRIWVEPAPDHGSIFYFTLPRHDFSSHDAVETAP